MPNALLPRFAGPPPHVNEFRVGHDPMIDLRLLSKDYPNAARVVDAVSLRVETGEFVALIGPSGSGKTTLLSMVNRLIEPSSGHVLIDGEDAQAADPAGLRRRIGFVFQDVGLFPHMTIAENVGITLRLLGARAADIAARVEELLALVRLEPELYRDRFPAALSGGQRQRVGVARALAARPSIMLMDEPFGAIDPLTRDDIAADYRAIHESLGLTTLLVTHDMTEAFLLADRIAIMRAGKLVQVGRPPELLRHPADDFVRAMVESPKRRAIALTEAMAASGSA
jgi:osmoprotectant transport system ATP-binding protein